MKLLLPPKFSHESNLIRRAAEKRGWEVIRLQRWQAPEHLIGETVAIYAEPLFAAKIAEDLQTSFPEPPDDWLVHLNYDMVLRRIRFTTLAEARQLEAPHFVKPANFKTFKASVFEHGKDLPEEEAAAGTEPVLIAEIVHFLTEFRVFLVDGKAVAASVYWRNGATAEKDGEWPASEEELAMARQMAEEAFEETKDILPRAVVIDVGEIEGKGWAVIEANPAWGSGLYGCDPDAVLDVLTACVTQA